ncbi:hypothetical protein DIPPA_29624 [Diplonema papillatum]|nr:hypothetical protein DIPPA_29624 [Diplonema papillatum]
MKLTVIISIFMFFLLLSLVSAQNGPLLVLPEPAEDQPIFVGDADNIPPFYAGQLECMTPDCHPGTCRIRMTWFMQQCVNTAWGSVQTLACTSDAIHFTIYPRHDCSGVPSGVQAVPFGECFMGNGIDGFYTPFFCHQANTTAATPAPPTSPPPM